MDEQGVFSSNPSTRGSIRGWGLFLLLLALLSSPARAHDFAPLLLTATEEAPGTWRLFLAPSSKGSTDAPSSSSLPVPRLDCPEPQPHLFRCTSSPSLEVTGLTSANPEVLTRVYPLTGKERVLVLTATTPPQPLMSPASGNSFVSMGFHHILTGWDHLLFLLGLVLLLPSPIPLLRAITGFTVGHLLTLALATSGVVSVPLPLVEVLIALSIAFLAAEAVSSHPDSPLRRRPALLSLAFGLLHGLGLATFLSQAGLSSVSLPISLFLFHLGVEMGQAGFLILVYFPLRLLQSPSRRRVAAYALGSGAMAMTLARTASFWTWSL